VAKDQEEKAKRDQMEEKICKRERYDLYDIRYTTVTRAPIS